MRHFYILLLAAAAATATVSRASAVDASTAPNFLSGWFIKGSVDGVYGSRNNSDAAVVTPLVAGPPIVTGNDLAFGNETGLDARLRAGFGAWSVEGRYFGGFRWDSTGPTLANPGNVQIGAFSNFGGNLLSSNANSKLDSWEANLRWQVNSHVTVFGGYRWIDLNDNVNINLAFNAFNALYTWNVPWRGNGFQVGTDIRAFGPGTSYVPLGPVFLDLDARVAFLNVDSSQSFALIPSTGGAFTNFKTYSANANAVEFGATVGVEILHNWELRGGYRYFQLGHTLFGVDTASQPSNSTSIVQNPRDLVIHAATFGVGAKFP